MVQSSFNKNGRFVNPILYFLHEDSYSEYNIIIASKEVNLGDGKRNASSLFVANLCDKKHVGNIKKRTL